MLYDLNIPWSPTLSPHELQRTISFLSELGYDTLALDHLMTGAIPSQITNPIPKTHSLSLPPKTIILRRCTVQLADPSLNHRLPALASAYDILALRPTNEKAFLAACTSITDHSLVSLDLTQRFPFYFRPKPLMAAIHRGIRFEICYAQATMGDANAKKNFISNCMGIFRATKGRGLVLSSGARGVLGLRGPADVVNLMAVWGLGTERALESLVTVPRSVVVNEGLKRTSFRGVIDVIDGGQAEPVKGETAEKNGKTPASEKEKQGKGKRKIEVVDGERTPQMSKRAAKKMRLAAKKAEEALPTSAKEQSTEKTSTPTGPDTGSIENKANG